jgi:hypothetical protein
MVAAPCWAGHRGGVEIACHQPQGERATRVRRVAMPMLLIYGFGSRAFSFVTAPPLR